MVPRLGIKSSNLWESAVACNGNLWFPGWQPCVPTFGNRHFLAMNQRQTFRYRSIKQSKAFCTGPLTKQSCLYRTIKQNKAFCSGPWRKTKRSVPVHQTSSKTIKLLKECFHVILTCTSFVQKHFYAGPSAKRKHSATGPLSKTKGLVTGSGNKIKQH